MWYKNMVTDTVECENHGEGRKPDISRLDWIRVKWGRRGIFKIICSFNKLIHLYFIIIIIKNNTNADLIIKVEYMSMSVCVCVCARVRFMPTSQSEHAMVCQTWIEPFWGKMCLNRSQTQIWGYEEIY